MSIHGDLDLGYDDFPSRGSRKSFWNILDALKACGGLCKSQYDAYSY